MLKAQILRRPVSAAFTCAGTYSFNHTDVFSFTTNQAALARIKNAAIGIYSERKFLMNELNFFNAVLALPTSSGNFGLNTMYSGFSHYNEAQLGLAYGRKLGNKLDIGAQFNYNRIGISGYGNADAVNFEIGTILHLTEQLHAGIHLNNPVGGKFGKHRQESFHQFIRLGLVTRLPKNLS